jgi:RNA polymerase sigma-70 factor (ECF subfamily)
VEGRPLEETDLAARAQAGDAAAYEALVRTTQDVAFRAAYLILGDAAEAEDAAQEGFVKAYYALERFRAGAPFRPWVLQIVANEARNRRKAAVRRAALASRAAEGQPSVDAAPSPEGAALAQETRQTLLTALDGLRDEERLAVACRYFLDLDEAETAAVLDCPRGTVKSRVSRALGRLRERLGGTSG